MPVVRGQNDARARGTRLWAAIVLAGCGEPNDPPRQAEPSATAEDVGGRRTTPWRFVPTLDASLPAGAVGVPVIELSQPRQRTVVIVAAVLRAGARHVELERWGFSQGADGESLDLATPGEPMVRLRPGTRSPKLADLRRELAAPRVVLTRPVGLAPEPRALVEALAAALATMHDASASARARVEAAATVVRGLDDAVLLERDAAWEVAEVLAPTPLPALEVEVLADRRARVLLPHAGGTAVLELQRKSDGWVIAGIERPKASAGPSDAPQP